jgi:enamine deaminase RidA (YjgF/YER057c/UK114 family)
VPVDDRFTDVPGVVPGPGYSHAVTTSGRLAFVAGQVALDAEGALVGGGDLAAQTRQAMANLQAVLATVGAGWADVAKLTWFVLDASQVQVLRDVRDEFLRPVLGERPNPASTLLQVAGLFRPDALVEIEAVVALPD